MGEGSGAGPFGHWPWRGSEFSGIMNSRSHTVHCGPTLSLWSQTDLDLNSGLSFHLENGRMGGYCEDERVCILGSVIE